MARIWRILSIDGGGIRGIIPAMILSHLEDLTALPIAELFDFIAGTSIGGVLALAITKPGSAGASAYSAAAIADWYKADGPHIFHNPASWFANILRAKYKATGLEQFLDRMFGSSRLKDALSDVLIPCYDIEHRSPHIFRSRWARRHSRYDSLMKDVARATCAAPTVFDPVRIQLPGKMETISLIDGGVFANNPTMYAYVDAKTILADDEDDFLVVSLGTGVSNKPLTHEDATRWGYAQWSRPIIELVCDSISDSVHSQMRYLLPPTEHQRYYRFQVDLPEESDDSLDNVSEANMQGLIRAAGDLISNPAASEEFGRLAARLLELHAGRKVPDSSRSLESPSVSHVPRSERAVSICFAEADRETVAHPLAEAFAVRGLVPIFEKFSVSAEHGIRRLVVEATQSAPYGVIILSRSLLNNRWAEKQIGWLCARLIGGQNLLLAITHGFRSENIHDIMAELKWHRAAASYLECLMELVQGSTDDGIEQISDVLTDEIINWHK